MSTFGWANYQRANEYLSWAPACITSDTRWTPYERLRYDTISSKNLYKRRFVARPLSVPWWGKLIPTLALSRSRLVIAAGSMLLSYAFCHAESGGPNVRLEVACRIGGLPTQGQGQGAESAHARHDISTIEFLPDGGADRTLLVGSADGYVVRVTLPVVVDYDKPVPNVKTEELYRHNEIVESISVSGDLAFSLSAAGRGILSKFSNYSSDTGTHSALHVGDPVNFSKRSWCSLLSSASGLDPYVALGSSSPTPLTIHPLLPGASTGMDVRPSAILGTRGGVVGSRRASAVYALTHAPPTFPGARPGAAIVSGWFDGCVRVYDVRMRSSSLSTSDAPVLAPALTLRDRWQPESIYAVSAGGPAGTTIAAGAARHAVVAFWDVRSPGGPVSHTKDTKAVTIAASNRFTHETGDDGWSVHAPGNDSSPVYALGLAGACCFGATQSRAFVLDFGGRDYVTPSTYPPLPPHHTQFPHSLAPNARSRRRGDWRGMVGTLGRLDDSGLRTEDGVHYDVSVYGHARPLAKDGGEAGGEWRRAL